MERKKKARGGIWEVCWLVGVIKSRRDRGKNRNISYLSMLCGDRVHVVIYLLNFSHIFRCFQVVTSSKDLLLFISF